MFSKELELSIAALFDKAHEANIQYITVEHLLLMIMSDFDVKEGVFLFRVPVYRKFSDVIWISFDSF